MCRGIGFAMTAAAPAPRFRRIATKSGHSMTALEQIPAKVLNFVISLVTIFGRLERLLRPLY
jgi:hypothetical protein